MLPNGEPFPPHLGKQLALARVDAHAKLEVLLPAVNGFFVALDALVDLGLDSRLASNWAACSDFGNQGNEVGIWSRVDLSGFAAPIQLLRPDEAKLTQALGQFIDCPQLLCQRGRAADQR